jgi:periplasmic protein CpxP/Spy
MRALVEKTAGVGETNFGPRPPASPSPSSKRLTRRGFTSLPFLSMQNVWLRGALSAVLISGLLATAVGATLDLPGQEPAARPQGPPPARGGNPQERAEQLAKSLKLNSQQQKEVMTILQNQHQQLEALRSSASAETDRAKGMSQRRRLDGETDAKLKAVLSVEQYNQYLAQKPQPGGPRDGQGGKGGRPPKGERPEKTAEQAN